jgi:hypothetical protein
MKLGRLIEDQAEEIDDADGRAPTHHAEKRKDEPGLVAFVQVFESLVNLSPQHALSL